MCMKVKGIRSSQERARVHKLLKTKRRAFSQERKSVEVVQMEWDSAGGSLENHDFGNQGALSAGGRGRGNYEAWADW